MPGVGAASAATRLTATAFAAIPLLLLLLLAPSCTRPPDNGTTDADVIVIGAGIAGLSAALEASAAGRTVLVVDANSVGGGHAVKAGGFALVGTPLQEKKGYHDSPEIAERDLLAWGEDADADWVHRYVRASRTDVYDWLTDFGVRWGFILDTPEHSVPRFHFANGAALNVVVPMMRAAFAEATIAFRWHSEAVALVRSGAAIRGVRIRDTRTGEQATLHAPAVIVATGGWQNNLDLVRREWRANVPPPARLYSGAGEFATGAGVGLARDVGAATIRMDHQVTFSTGLPDPRDPTGRRALLSQNPAAIWVNSGGQRFLRETAPTKLADMTVLKLTPATHWLIFDADGLRTLRVRDAVWLNNPAGIDPLRQAGLIKQADSVASLAVAAGLPPAALEATVERWNADLRAGNDTEFHRFTPDKPDPSARALSKAPYYAMQLFPMTRKSMGGLAIDAEARVLDLQGQPIPGLFAAGEVTGMAGINGSYGGEGTFLGPSVFLGRIAGRLAQSSDRSAFRRDPAAPGPVAKVEASTDPAYRTRAITVPAESLEQLVNAQRPGYWHFQSAHRIVLERKLDCTTCHTPDWPTEIPTTSAQRQVQLLSCATCH